MEVQFWAATDVGKSREHNEDNFLVDKRLNLFIVCDGMGGHAAGEVASAVAVRAIRDVVANNREIFDQCAESPNNPKLRKDLLRVLEYSIQEACSRIYEMAQADASRRGMGTTCSMMMVAGRRCFIAHVGDSRIYLYRKGQVHQLTEDHTLANEMVRRGRASSPSDVDARYKNAITRAVGVYESVEVDTLDFDILSGDRFMLCSDGLSGYLEGDLETIGRYVGPREVRTTATQEELKRITADLIGFANESGGKDNITVVLVGVSDETEDIETEEVHLTMETIRNIPLFHYLSYKELVRVVNTTQKRAVAQSEEVVREGEEGEELFIIMRGTFAVFRGEREVARLGPGRHFGEMALIDDGPRSATIRALTSGTALTIRRSDFYNLLRKDPTLAVKLLWNFIQTLSTRLREVPVAQPRASREFVEAGTASQLRVPPAITTEEIDLDLVEDDNTNPPGLSLPGKAPLEPPVDSPLSLIDDIRRIESITGEEITLPGVRADELPPRPTAESLLAAGDMTPPPPGMLTPPGMLSAPPMPPPIPSSGPMATLKPPSEAERRRHNSGHRISSAITSIEEPQAEPQTPDEP